MYVILCTSLPLFSHDIVMEKIGEPGDEAKIMP